MTESIIIVVDVIFVCKGLVSSFLSCIYQTAVDYSLFFHFYIPPFFIFLSNCYFSFFFRKNFLVVESLLLLMAAVRSSAWFKTM